MCICGGGRSWGGAAGRPCANRHPVRREAPPSSARSSAAWDALTQKRARSHAARFPRRSFQVRSSPSVLSFRLPRAHDLQLLSARPACDWGGPAAVTEGAKGRSSPDRQLGDRKVSPGADCGLEGDAPSPSSVTSSLPTEARAPQSLRWAPGRAGGGCGQGGREPGGDGLPVSSLRIPKKKATPSPPLGTLRRLLQATHSPGTASSMEWGDPS